MRQRSIVMRRAVGYVATSTLLVAWSITLRGSRWQGGAELHSFMELAATLLALNVGVLSLVRFYSKKDNTFLFIGSGFLGTGLLDAYHAVVTSSHFATLSPSVPASLIPWSWLASRLFLSVALCLSWLFWKPRKFPGGINENLVYVGFSAFTAASFVFFATVPLPSGYIAYLPFGRPQEIIPAVLFGLALIGYLRKSQWRTDPFEHWLVLSLIVNFLTQSAFMSNSGHLYDASFDAAHLLKMGSYNCVLIGLLTNMYRLFWMSISEPIMILNGDVCINVNEPMARLFGYTQEEMLRLDLAAIFPDGDSGTHGVKVMLRSVPVGARHEFEWRCNAKGDRFFWAGIEVQHGAFGVQDTILLRAHDITGRKQAQDDLQQEQEFTAALIDSLPGFLVLIDQAGRLVRWNDNLSVMTGLSDERLQGLDAMQIAVASDHAMMRQRMRDAFTRGFASVEFGMPDRSGEVHTVRWSGRIITNENRQYLLAIGNDVTEARVVETQLRESEERFRTIFSFVHDGIIVQEADTGIFIDVNPRICEMFGYTREEVLKLDLEDLSTGASPYTVDEIVPLLRRASDEAVVFEWHCKAKDGHLFWIEVSLRRAAFGAQNILLSTARDITERVRTSEQISHMARYDALTGLANRRVFVETLDQMIARARRGAKSFALLYLDLDHFKDVNDTLGHPVGDLLLQEVAERLRASVRAVDTVARFGGDEFAIILTDIVEPADAARVSERLLDAIGERTGSGAQVAAVAGGIAEKIVQAVAVPVVIQGNQINSGASVGIAVYGPNSLDAETMLSHADVALYRAKAERRGTYRFFTDVMDTEVRARVRMSKEFREAINAEQLFLMYQPQVDIHSGRIVGLEALVRWHHPARGTLGPGKFIPAAERDGLIVPMGQWVMRAACQQAKQWVMAGIAPPVIAINLSGVQFKMPVDLEKDIAAILAASGLPARLLELELTETVLMEASREHNDLLLRLRQKGHRIAIDDFGSGYSSLDYLRRYPVDRIKIAQSFIADVGIVSGNDAIVRAALGLARELSIEVVVEGVETTAQLKLLKSWGCQIVQGYYFARPLLVPDVTALLRVGKITPAYAGAVDVAAPG